MSERLETGSLISQSFSMLAENAATFLGLAVLAMLPVALVNLTPAIGLTATFVAGLLQAVLIQLVTAAITYAVFARLRGSAPGFSECLSVGLRRFVPVLLVGLLVGVVTTIGFLMLVIPGLIAMTMFFVAIPVVVVEKPPVIAAIERSVDLTKGHRWTVFFLIVFLTLLGIGLGLAVTGLLGAGGVLHAVVTLVGTTVTTALQSTAAALTYYRLREVKENLDLADIAQVFE